ncbi:hypothetical protein F5Y11DRAFT_336948 [Daldinia sp. FL1419]|nr:hypothetical protein F5Y11DRAFT_336948 [Daldinia sp. FL1419]
MIRLIHCGERKFHEFDYCDLPKYAIISHRRFIDASGSPEEVGNLPGLPRTIGRQSATPHTRVGKG